MSFATTIESTRSSTISYLRRPQTVVYRDSYGNIVDPPRSISSAISMTEHLRHHPPSYNNEDDDEEDVIHDLHCVADEPAVNLEHMCQLTLDKTPTNDNFIPLLFEVVSEDGGRYSSVYSVENILKNDGTVYCSERKGTINILLQYKGWSGNQNQRQKTCVLSHIVIKSPQFGYTAPCKDGMIFISHEPIDIEKTRRFDNFTRQDYENYIKEPTNNSYGIEPAAFFTANHTRQAVINMKLRSTRYVLIKLLRADHESENMDVQYVGFVGYTGARAFINKSLF